MYQDNPPPYSAAPPPESTGMAPPPPGIKPGFAASEPYPQQPSVQTTHVVITSGPVAVLGPVSQHMICPSCHAQISTTVRTEPSTKTHLFALLLCLLQCYLCCCIPYCVDSCQSQNHYCPNCNAYLGCYEN